MARCVNQETWAMQHVNNAAQIKDRYRCIDQRADCTISVQRTKRSPYYDALVISDEQGWFTWLNNLTMYSLEIILTATSAILNYIGSLLQILLRTIPEY